jgi:hypothetical protein
MDTELAQRLMELGETTARIDERTVAIHDSQEQLSDALKRHEAEDRADFKEVHDRITRVDRKQSWMLGVATAAVVSAGMFLKGFFGGG